ncbi:MAG: RNA polymerase factor sigma-54 [Deltaproteobacteria bacterium]|nr:RNA polymerase factor sigma-54 [Deltaproteobacteria bacterium]
MAIELKQQLRISQQLVMTPQLQQAIKLLQLNQLELANLVEQELQENPCLEQEESEEETPDELADSTPGEEANDAPSDEDAAVDGEVERDAEAPGEILDPTLEPDFTADDAAAPTAEPAEGPSDVEKIADVEWDDYMDSHPQTGLEGRVGGDDDERRSLEATLTRRPTLAEHLRWQIQLSDFDEEEIAVSEWIIGNLDERGYLCASVEEIARQADFSCEQVEAVLHRVQELDPAGVAARDLRECLMRQIESIKSSQPIVYCIVDEHLDLLQKRDFRGLCRLLNITSHEVAAASAVISNLEPRPGRGFGGDDPVYITPDIYVYKVGDDFHVLLNEDGLPKLKINNVYKAVLSRKGAPIENARDTKNYVQDKVRSAMWLIKSIHQRQRTIYKVMQSIIRYQRDFFDRGVAHLRPLNLRDVADDIEMHESTVSRVTTNKYVHTPQGIYELKYFFNSSINCVNGDSVASESVKEKIRKIITRENPVKPMSDQRIAEELKSANIDIARRTVTKYREAMNILSSTKRRQVV